MKLFRSDLEQHISNQLFEISADSLDLNDLQVAGGQLACTLSIDPTPHGYHIYGALKIRVHETCDRCLTEFEEKHESPLNVILTDNEELLSEKNVDVIRFETSDEFIDLSPVIHDLVVLEEPIKRLCDKACKGLCPSCGINLNKATCACSASANDFRWDALKNLKNKDLLE
ncbi:MAG: DUF177 domain-containing protein [Candidatus Marinimicrobia bacterium]|nr:DUF177 domain-containing protein [Candidatus Neomarinimicrobiota bacterium]